MTKYQQYSSLLRLGLLWLLTLISGVLVIGCSAAETPQTYHVGIVSSLGFFNPIADGFKDGMAELGYIEGENITYDFKQSSENEADLAAIMEEFVADEVDLIFTFPSGATDAAKPATEGTDIPVVFSFATLELTDLVASLREPGGNLTGVQFPGADLTVIRFEILMEIMPEAKRVLVLHNITYSASIAALEALEVAAPTYGVEIVVVPISDFPDIQPGLEAHIIDGVPDFDAILIMPEGLVQSPDGWPIVSQFAAKYKIPIGGSAAFEAEAGAVFSHIPDSYESGKLAAPFADKIFQGTAPGSIPIVTPDSHLHINITLAGQLGLTVPDRLLSLAEKIIR